MTGNGFHLFGIIGLFTPAVVFGQVSSSPEQEPPFTDTFFIEDCEFSTESENRYFPLEVGRQSVLSNLSCFQAGECDELTEVQITVQDQTRTIPLEIGGELRNITTRVVEERETVDGELAEVSRNFFAVCADTQDVYYFGEEVDIYEDGQIVAHDGAWLAGQNDARPGIIMPGGEFLLGSRYFQEIAPDVALDRAEHLEKDLSVSVPAGNFEQCVRIEETTPLDPAQISEKVYCPNVGLVSDDEAELIR